MKRRAKTDGELAAALRAWGRARHLLLAVVDARNGQQCEVEHVGGFEPDDPAEPACWKSLEWDSDGMPTDPEDWCAACLLRQRWHLVHREVARRYGARLRILQRISLAPEVKR